MTSIKYFRDEYLSYINAGRDPVTGNLAAAVAAYGKSNMAEIRGAQTNTNEQANAPKENVEQQASQGTIARRLGGTGRAWSATRPRTRRRPGAQTQQTRLPRRPRRRTAARRRPRIKRGRSATERRRKGGRGQGAGGRRGGESGGRQDGERDRGRRAVEVPEGTLAIEACFRAGADVPYFCYHPRLTSVGACRMCWSTSR
jgi:hypothetical protein